MKSPLNLNPLFLLTGLIVAQLSWAQDNPYQQLPINLQADAGEFDANTGIATYTGNVSISQGDMHLKGDKVVIRLSDGEVATLEAWGNLASFRYVPQGEPPIDGKGEYMKYNVSASTVEISKQAHVKQGANETKGERLTYHLKEDIVRGKAVRMTFQPKSS